MCLCIALAPHSPAIPDVEPDTAGGAGAVPGRELQRQPAPSSLPSQKPPTLHTQQKLNQDGKTLCNPA